MAVNAPNASALLAIAAGYLRDAVDRIDSALHSLDKDPALESHSDELRQLQEQIQALMVRPPSESA